MHFQRHFPYHKKNILYCILNWGLGHASRSSPIIRHLINSQNKIYLASDGIALKFLSKEFPALPQIELPSYHISYPFNSMTINMLLLAPGIIRAINKEKKLVDHLAVNEQIDIIISDHRYGCRSDFVGQNLVIAHQLNILSPNLRKSFILGNLNKYMLNKFDQCLIPDHPGEKSLAGVLSSSTGIRKPVYLGLISRFKTIESEYEYDVVIILSGPEPSRTRLENLIIGQTSKLSYRFLLVRGVLEQQKFSVPENLSCISFLNTVELNLVLSKSRIVVCRAGYSSIMDLVQLNKKALLIPTPGQTEQEYLAERLHGKGKFIRQLQNELNLEKAIKELL